MAQGGDLTLMLNSSCFKGHITLPVLNWRCMQLHVHLPPDGKINLGAKFNIACADRCYLPHRAHEKYDIFSNINIF